MDITEYASLGGIPDDNLTSWDNKTGTSKHQNKHQNIKQAIDSPKRGLGEGVN